MTCSKLITNKLGLCHTKSDNVQFADIEQALLLLYFFAHDKHN